jgi:hypothetical protein
MAVKKALEVVPLLPEPDLEALLAARLADDLIADVDMGKIARLAIAHIGNTFKVKIINFLLSDGGSVVPLTEIEAAAEEEVAA